MALLDFNNIKEINHVRGRHDGDTELQKLVDNLLEAARRTDTIARLSGDNFIVFMPSTQEVDCKSYCRQLADRITIHMADIGLALAPTVGSMTFTISPKSTLDARQLVDQVMAALKVSSYHLPVTSIV